MIERRYTGLKPATAMPAGAIDAQLHLYLPGFPAHPGGPPLPPALPGPAEYRQVMAWLGIERLVVTQGNAHQFDNGNLLACLDAMGDRARGVAVIDGTTSDAEIEALHAQVPIVASSCGGTHETVVENRIGHVAMILVARNC